MKRLSGQRCLTVSINLLLFAVWMLEFLCFLLTPYSQCDRLDKRYSSALKINSNDSDTLSSSTASSSQASSTTNGDNIGNVSVSAFDYDFHHSVSHPDYVLSYAAFGFLSLTMQLAFGCLWFYQIAFEEDIEISLVANRTTKSLARKSTQQQRNAKLIRTQANALGTDTVTGAATKNDGVLSGTGTLVLNKDGNSNKSAEYEQTQLILSTYADDDDDPKLVLSTAPASAAVFPPTSPTSSSSSLSAFSAVPVRRKFRALDPSSCAASLSCYYFHRCLIVANLMGFLCFFLLLLFGYTTFEDLESTPAKDVCQQVTASGLSSVHECALILFFNFVLLGLFLLLLSMQCLPGCFGHALMRLETKSAADRKAKYVKVDHQEQEDDEHNAFDTNAEADSNAHTLREPSSQPHDQLLQDHLSPPSDVREALEMLGRKGEQIDLQQEQRSKRPPLRIQFSKDNGRRMEGGAVKSAAEVSTIVIRSLKDAQKNGSHPGPARKQSNTNNYGNDNEEKAEDEKDMDNEDDDDDDGISDPYADVNVEDEDDENDDNRHDHRKQKESASRNDPANA